MLIPLDTKDFDSVYTIMQDSFPIDEYRPYDEQKALFKNKEYKVWVWLLDGKISAFISVWDFDSFLYAEHFAVQKNQRGNKIGTKILEQISLQYKKTICLEVEPPICDISKRRVLFYERCGFTLNTYPYMQPPISKGRKSIPLMIMSSSGALSLSEFENIRDTLYKKVYKSI